jgi:hypothetical protein
MEISMQPQYWVVGAMFGGKEDRLAEFIHRGYWYCWDPKFDHVVPSNVEELFPKIRVDDRLVVKKMLGQGSPKIEIRALGIVTDIDILEWRVYVNWVVTGLSREVHIKNFMGSLHGPIEDTEWRREAFTI